MRQHCLNQNSPEYPELLQTRVGADRPKEIIAAGNMDLLSLSKTALFCSVSSPGSVILRTYDQAARFRDESRCIISGFHSPVEKECLRILLRGTQPIIICPARSLPVRIPAEWQQPFSEGRILLLSPFSKENRTTSKLAVRRNEFVAALSDNAWFAHIAPGGQAEQLTHRFAGWNVPFSKLDNLTEAAQAT